MYHSVSSRAVRYHTYITMLHRIGCVVRRYNYRCITSSEVVMSLWCNKIGCKERIRCYDIVSTYQPNQTQYATCFLIYKLFTNYFFKAYEWFIYVIQNE